MKTRKDVWTADQDELLKEIVLNAIQEGKTKKAGIEIASKKIKRSIAACSYRFYEVIKRNSPKGIKEVVSSNTDNLDNVESKTKSVYIVENPEMTESKQRQVTIESIMEDIQTLLLQNKENEEMKQKNEELEKRNQELESKLSGVSSMLDTLKSLNI